MAYDFDKIAKSYDRLNHIMTAGLDRLWRRRVVRTVAGGEALDVACGTGDMVVELLKRGCTVTGVDLSKEMLTIAEEKAHGCKYMMADAEHLPFEDGTFDAVTCAFGVRNFVHLEQGLAEMLRVLRPGGRMVIMELATPDNALVRSLYDIYANRLIPRLGKRLAGSREAYTYLPQSIARFPKGKEFTDILARLGAFATEQKLTFGVCRVYTVRKQKDRSE